MGILQMNGLKYGKSDYIGFIKTMHDLGVPPFGKPPSGYSTKLAMTIVESSDCCVNEIRKTIGKYRPRKYSSSQAACQHSAVSSNLPANPLRYPPVSKFQMLPACKRKLKFAPYGVV